LTSRPVARRRRHRPSLPLLAAVPHSSSPSPDEDDDDDDVPPPRGHPAFSLVRAPVLALFNAPLLPTGTGAVRLFEPHCLAALEAALQGSAGSKSPASFVHLLSPSRAPRDLLSDSHGLPRVGSLAEITAVDRSSGDGIVVSFRGVRRVEVLAVETAVVVASTPTSPYPLPHGSSSSGGRHKVASCVFVDDEPPVAAARGIPSSVASPSSGPPTPPPMPPHPNLKPKPPPPPLFSPSSRNGNSGNSGNIGSKMTISIDNPRAAALERELSAALSAVVSLAAKRARAAGAPEPRLPEAVALLAPPPAAGAGAPSPSPPPKKPTSTAVAQGLRAGGFRAAASAVDVWKRQSGSGGGGEGGASSSSSAADDDKNKAPSSSSSSPAGAFPSPIPSSSSSTVPSNPYASVLVAGPAAPGLIPGGSLHRRRELFSFAAASALDLDVPVAAALLLSTSTEARLEFVLSAVRTHLGELTAREALRGVEGVRDAVPPEEEEDEDEEGK